MNGLIIDLWVTVGAQTSLFAEMRLFGAMPGDIPKDTQNYSLGRPSGVTKWVNIYDPADALSYKHQPVFGDVTDIPVSEGGNLTNAHGHYFVTVSFHETVLWELRGETESVGRGPSLTSVRDLLLDPIQNFADGLILSAEIFARQENPALAARQILRIRPGALPLYTDGFSLWMNRLRELLDDDGGGLDETTVSKLRSLKRTLGKWDRYVDLTSPTVTFPGADASSPQLSPMPSAGAEPDPSQGWLPIRPSSVLEAVHQKWEAIKLDPIPQAPAADEKQQEISTQLVNQIERFSAACIQRYRRIKFAGNLLTMLGLGAPWGVIAAGTYGRHSLVVLFAATSTAVLATNRWFGFDARAQRYRILISEARILATEAKNSCIPAPNVVRRLRKLINDRAAADLSW